MSDSSFDSWVRGVMSGEARGVAPGALRAALRAIEPGYALATRLRNRRFDRGGSAVKRLPRPVVSVGNLTTGGTGKTPFVQWLVRELLALGHRPAILMRGYARADGAAESDEQRVLRESLPDCPVYADPDRHAAGIRALAERPTTDVFVLDDGFQHRRLARDVDLVLIDATNPFGYDHVLPRGMLREPVEGLARAHLVAITRAERVDEGTLNEIETRVRSLVRRETPIVRLRYVMDEVRIGDERTPLAAFAGRSAFAISAIGNPQAFEDGLVAAGLRVVGTRRFTDHHAYTQNEVDSVLDAARTANADLVLTTEKDWAKLRELDVRGATIGRVGVRIAADDATRAAIIAALKPAHGVPGGPQSLRPNDVTD